jgi:hypothetical protein
VKEQELLAADELDCIAVFRLDEQKKSPFSEQTTISWKTELKTLIFG